MPGKKEGNRKKRRFVPQGAIDGETRARFLKQLRYECSPHHKLRPGDYGIKPNPRQDKTACDDLRPLNSDEAEALLKAGIEREMVSDFSDTPVPKYIWAVDGDGEVYEAKCKPENAAQDSVEPVRYHGYPLKEGDLKWKDVTREWKRRAP